MYYVEGPHALSNLFEMRIRRGAVMMRAIACTYVPVRARPVHVQIAA